MAYKSKRARIEIGRLFLNEPTRKYPYWRICWYDAGSEQTRGVPARPKDDPKGHIVDVTTEDRDAAHKSMLRFAAKHPELAVPEKSNDLGAIAASGQTTTAANDLSVLQCLLMYDASQEVRREAKRKKRKRKEATNINKPRTTMKLVARVLGDPTCRQMTPSAQAKIIAHLRAKGRSDRTIVDRLKLIWTAMLYARDRELVVPEAIPPRLPGRSWEPPARLRKRNTKLTDDQIVKMFTAAADLATPEYIWRWLIIQVGAVCRPSAPLEVDAGYVDWEVGNLVLLEEDDVQEDNKRKATIRCCPTLLGWLKTWALEERQVGHAPQFIRTATGKALDDTGFHKALAAKAGVVLPKGTDAYIWRHTLITWLARHGVPDEQRKFMAGHRIADGSHGDYIHFEPDYLKEAVEAIEALFRMVDSKLPPGGRRLVSPVALQEQGAMLDNQPVPEREDVGQSYIRMLRRSSYLVENRGYSVADFSEILNGIKCNRILLESPAGTCDHAGSTS